MAVVEYSHAEICRFLGKNVKQEELHRNLDMLGAPVDSFEGDLVRCDITPNRLDLLSVEGIARALSNFMGIRKPWDYEVKKSGVELAVEKSVQEVRPFIVAAIVRGMRIDDSTIKSLMQVQEKIHTTYGRNRKKVAIGIHDLAKLKPPFVYKAVHPDGISFVPLDMPESMSLGQILKKHPKGIAHAHVLAGRKKYPVIVDANGNVLSFPPIINGELTRVSESTTDVFIDVTGTSPNAVADALNVLCALFADRGGKLFSVKIGGKNFPDMGRRSVIVSPKKVNALIGFSLSGKEMEKLLARMGHVATGSEPLDVKVPAYRADVLSWVDIAEDVAIAYGYNELEPTLPKLQTIGKLLEGPENVLREALVGLGFCELMTFTLSNESLNYARMGLKTDGKATRITNPLTADFTLFRTWLSPSLLSALGSNSHESMPQKVFEVGTCMQEGRKKRKLACAIVKAKASFSEIRSIAEAVASEAGWKMSFNAGDHPSFIPGRCVFVLIGNKQVGVLGEIHPQVLNSFGIEEPLILFEMELE